ncbi:pyridoxal phosphate-dependent transferase [Xylariales sp. AK1849]|nr:pyridoxal phosphate-dependent transferase [Xylariales sp. AK1849]
MSPQQLAVNGQNGSFKSETTLNRAAEVEDLIDAVKSLIIPYIEAADEAASTRASGALPSQNASNQASRNVLVETRNPEELIDLLRFTPTESAGGRSQLLETIQGVLRYSVNTWDQGFLDKLYSSTNAVGVISELLLSVLNTNVHVYQVSPALTIIEKRTAQTLASLFGFTGSRSGGVTCQGGSSSNLSSLVIARNTLFPSTKTSGNGTHHFVLFTSVHGHYSVEKAAITCGMGASSVVSVPVDNAGCMIPSALHDLIVQAKAEGKTPLYVNATAGTTVLGSYDPFRAVSAVCKEFNIWLHIDGSWGGSVIFSSAQKHKLAGSELADSITVNPHKMMNVPLTCSFLLTNDLGVFHKANTLPAGYLFHAVEEDEEVWDLADLTLQCGRRGDALKLALGWIYYGTEGFERQIDHAFHMASHLASLIADHPHFELVSSNPPPCLQVCFYYAPRGEVAENKKESTRRTSEMVAKLIQRGFMVDYAPGDRGSFFRVVVNCQTLKGTVDGLVKALEEVGREVVKS